MLYTKHYKKSISPTPRIRNATSVISSRDVVHKTAGRSAEIRFLCLEEISSVTLKAVVN